jgi:hypothetical protein
VAAHLKKQEKRSIPTGLLACVEATDRKTEQKRKEKKRSVRKD